MGKASSAKKVARAARTGGGRTRRGSTSWVWPSLMAVVVILGSAGIVYSRDQRQPDNTRPLAAAAGRAGDHWHAAIGFYICDSFAANPPDTGQDPLGVHSHGDGVAHLHPFSAQSSGRRATLDIFFGTVNVKASSTSIQVPGQDAHKNGQKCGDSSAQVRTKVWGSRDPADQGRIVTANPSDIRPTDGMLITVAFVPEGADIPRPPSADNLSKLTDIDPAARGATPSTIAPGEASTTTTVAGDPASSGTSVPSTGTPATGMPTTAGAPSTTRAP